MLKQLPTPAVTFKKSTVPYTIFKNLLQKQRKCRIWKGKKEKKNISLTLLPLDAIQLVEGGLLLHGVGDRESVGHDGHLVRVPDVP